MQALYNCTAWATGIAHLSRHKFAASDTPIRCTIIDLPHETTISFAKADIDSLVQRWTPALRNSSHIRDKLRHWLETVQAKGITQGSCDCEAGSMASIVNSYEGSKHPLPDVSSAFKDILTMVCSLHSSSLPLTNSSAHSTCMCEQKVACS